MKTLPLVLAALGGAVVGASIALLFAPQKGECTRKQIKDFIKAKCPCLKTEKVEELADKIQAEIDQHMPTCENC